MRINFCSKSKYIKLWSLNTFYPIFETFIRSYITELLSMPNKIALKRIKTMLSLYKQGNGVNIRGTARELKISRQTVRKYLDDFKTLRIAQPEKIDDEKSFIDLIIADNSLPLKTQELFNEFPKILN